jgi:glycerate kinase
MVITGEGRIDASTLMGKGAGEIARHCRRWKVPCVAIGGEIRDRAKVNRVFVRTMALTDLTTPSKAKAKPAQWLERLAENAAREAQAHLPPTGRQSRRD